MPRRSRRAVYDPSIENDQLMKTTLFRDDPLASGGDVDGDEEDIRLWSNNASGTHRSSKRKGWYLLVTVIILLVVMVIVGVVVRNNKNSSSQNSSSNSSNSLGNNNNNPTQPTTQPTLDPPIATLSQLCSRDRVEQAELRTACEMECAKAACCAQDCNTGANTSSIICQSYQAVCEILLLTSVTPAAPSNSGLPMPPPELSQICALEQLVTAQGYQKCQAMCETASCCHYLPMSDPANCAVAYHTECIAFHSSCGILDHVTAPVPQEKIMRMPPDNLPSLCAVDQLETLQGYEACSAACESAQCCTASSSSSSSSNCFAEYASWCQEYAGPCSVLSQMVPPAPTDLPALCAADRLRTVTGYEQCEAICARATCCHLGTCATTTNEQQQHCVEYQSPCSSILESSAIKPSSSETPVAANQGVSAKRMHPPPSYISEQCTIENIESSAEGRQRCADICVKADCCQYPSNLVELSCLAGNEDVCAQYHSYCVLLDDNNTTDMNNDDPPPSQWSNEYYDISMTDIYVACSDLTTTASLQACHDVCSQARCCYATGAGSCIDDERCDDFDMCFNYKALSFVHEDIPALIQRNCADLVSLEGLELCEASCEQAVCCFTSDNTLDCDGQDLSYCHQYEACKALVYLSEEEDNGNGRDGNDDNIIITEIESEQPELPTSTREQVELACGSNLNYEACLNLCDKGRCCWNSDETVCSSGIDCSTYAACDILV